MKLPRNPINGWIVASVPSPHTNGRYQGWAPCMKWCANQFEQHNWRYASEGVFEFRRAEDHMMFTLRWA